MDFKAILVAMSGPLNTVLRYGVGYLGVYLVNKGWVDDATWTSIGGGLLAALALGIGALTSTASVKTKAVAGLPEVSSVQKTDGTQVQG